MQVLKWSRTFELAVLITPMRLQFYHQTGCSFLVFKRLATNKQFWLIVYSYSFDEFV